MKIFNLALFSFVILGFGWSCPAQTTANPTATESGHRILDEKDVGKKVTVFGVAKNAKLGAIVLVERQPVYLKDKNEWDASILNQTIQVTGTVRSFALPQAAQKNGEWSAGAGQTVKVFRLEDFTWELHSESAPSNQLKRLISPVELQSLKDAKEAKSYRLASMTYSPMVMPDFYDSKFGKLAQGKNLSATELESIRAMLLKDRNLRTEPLKDCSFNPGVGVDLSSFGLLFCFSCKEWALKAGEKMIYAPFEAGEREWLVKLAKRVFPEDAEIARLSN